MDAATLLTDHEPLFVDCVRRFADENLCGLQGLSVRQLDSAV